MERSGENHIGDTKLLSDANENQLYRTDPQIKEQSRLLKFISSQYQPIRVPTDDESIKRTLRLSKSADFNTRVHLDTNDESMVSSFLNLKGRQT